MAGLALELLLRIAANRSGRRLRLVLGRHQFVVRATTAAVVQGSRRRSLAAGHQHETALCQSGRRILGDVAELRQDDVITVLSRCPAQLYVGISLKLLDTHSRMKLAIWQRGTPLKLLRARTRRPISRRLSELEQMKLKIKAEAEDEDEDEAKDEANKSAVTTKKGPDQPAIMLAADPSTVSKVPTVSADAAAASASASASSSASGDPMEANLNCTICSTVSTTSAGSEAFPCDDDGNLPRVAYFGMNAAVRVRRAVPDLSAASVGDPTAFAARLPPVPRAPGYAAADPPQQPLAPLRAAARARRLWTAVPIWTISDGSRCKLLTCPDNQAHLLCQCCWQAFPDRRADPSCPAENRRFQCALCQRFFSATLTGAAAGPAASAAWPNSRISHSAGACSRTLSMATRLNPRRLPHRQQYGAFATCSRECCARLAAGEYRCSRPVRPDTPVCYACGQACLRELALAYRSGLPAASLPAEAASRPNCHWGSECRTQFNKPEHAKRFNHACRRP
uniref:RING-type E3 ubiquitin transferase n=1 Tax=Macrostomum lignano TaxID=282301 RepID=A0A1I8F932_9PLAT